MWGLLRLLTVFFIVWGLLGWGWTTNPYAAGMIAWFIILWINALENWSLRRRLNTLTTFGKSPH